MAYTPIDWADGEDGATPVSADNLNHMDTGIEQAHTLAGQADDAATEARQARDDAATSASTASDKAHQAIVAHTTIESLAGSSEASWTKVKAAQQDINTTAGDVETAKTDAETAAGEAQTSAGEAQSIAGSLDDKVDAAETAAGDAINAKSDAQGFAGTATTKAGEADQSSTDASGSATTASGYADTAETMKGQAEDARDRAETAAETAEAGVPEGGWTTSDLSTGIQGKLTKAGTAIQPADIETKADLTGGKVPTSQIPAIALTDVFTVANQAEMLALTTKQVQPGDVAVRGDKAGTFILQSTDPSKLGSWVLLSAPSGKVDSVNGQQGEINLGPDDLGLGNVDNTSDANKPVSTATANALDGKSGTGHTHVTGDISGLNTALADKSDDGHSHSTGDISGLDAKLAGNVKGQGGITDLRKVTADPGSYDTGVLYVVIP